MARIILKVLIAIALGLFFVLAVVLAFHLADWDLLREFGDGIIGSFSPVGQGAILVLGMLLTIAVAVLTFYISRQEVHITRESENGTVTIVESAIARYVQQALSDMEAVKRRTIRTHIANTRQGLVVDVRTRVAVVDSLPNIENGIRTRVREALDRLLGPKAVAAVNVIIEGFDPVGKLGPAPVAPVEAPAAASAEPSTATIAASAEAPVAPESAVAPSAPQPDVMMSPEEKVVREASAAAHVTPKPSIVLPGTVEVATSEPKVVPGGGAAAVTTPATGEAFVAPVERGEGSSSSDEATEPEVVPFEEYGKDLTAEPTTEPAQPETVEIKRYVTTESEPEKSGPERTERNY